MYKVQFVMEGFSWAQRHEAAERMRDLLDCLTKQNVRWLLRHPYAPPLYKSGVVYQREPPGQEDWQDIPTTLRRRNGDCEDLACWRAAELQVRKWPAIAFGRARPMLVPGQREPGTLWHIQVLHPTGVVEDPSRRLGMDARAAQEAASGWWDPLFWRRAA